MSMNLGKAAVPLSLPSATSEKLQSKILRENQTVLPAAAVAPGKG